MQLSDPYNAMFPPSDSVRDCKTIMIALYTNTDFCEFVRTPSVQMAQFFMKMAEAVQKNTLKPGGSIPGCNSYFLCKYLKDTMLQARCVPKTLERSSEKIVLRVMLR